MEENLKLILNELKELNQGQQELIKNVTSINDTLINGIGPYFDRIEKHIDVKTDDLIEALEDQQRVIDTLAARSIKHESEIKNVKYKLKNQ
ncbi:hypothetical protein [Bacillus sp. EB01]|uniref:hypothetical protein n=1 Tax=Bacillus sp. EB01 TaxID=1347086 RepID=UPI0005C5988D|nr:hypothetical protein [Bacillus sp. EB01]